MLRARGIFDRGTVERYAEAVALLKGPGDYALVSRGMPRSVAMLCPDGCGEVIAINLDSRTGPAWRLFERAGRLTIYPSIWRESGCRAHFIVWNDRVLWCDADEPAAWDDRALIAAVRAALPGPGAPHRHFEEMAATLGEVPWEVLWACQALVRAGSAASSERGVKFGAVAGVAPRRGRLDVEA